MPKKEENEKKIEEIEKQIGAYKSHSKDLEIYHSYLLNL